MKTLRKAVTLPQWCILVDAKADGRATIAGPEKIAARQLQSKGYGAMVNAGAYDEFVINPTGRRLLE